MAQYYNQGYSAQPPSSSSAQNLQFYPSSYTSGHVSGHTTPSQATYGGYGSPSNPAAAYPGYGVGVGSSAAPFGAGPAVSGRMGEQGGLRTGWLAAFGTEGYDGEPPLLEELGVNFGHIRTKVRQTRDSHPSLTPDFDLPVMLRSSVTLTLFCCISDPHSTQPPHHPIPPHNGRLRPLRRAALPHPLRHLPSPQRQIFLRLHLRHRALWIVDSASDLQSDDAAFG